MPQDSYLFAAGRIKVLETKMLDKGRWDRLREADESEALRILVEAGYGAGAESKGDVEPLISAELESARSLAWELTPDPVFISLFLLPTDAHNLKTLYKARLLEMDADDLLEEGGTFPLEQLKKCVEDGSYDLLPDYLAGALRELDEEILRRPDPRVLSAGVDRAVFGYAFSVLDRHKNAFIRQYFTARVDFINAQSVVRARSLGWDAQKLLPLLVPGGNVPVKELAEAVDLTDEQLMKKLRSGENGFAIAAALEEYFQSGSAQAFERRMDSALMAIIRTGKDDYFGIGVIVGYLLGREAEAKALRVLFAAKRAGVEAKLPDLYA